jgi:hypothetical protein
MIFIIHIVTMFEIYREFPFNFTSFSLKLSYRTKFKRLYLESWCATMAAAEIKANNREVDGVCTLDAEQPGKKFGIF